MTNPMDYICNELPREEILLQLAEEAAELSQAALKLRRVMDGTNPTPVTRGGAQDNLVEEIADVWVCLDLLGLSHDKPRIRKIMSEKLERWSRRLEEKYGIAHEPIRFD